MTQLYVFLITPNLPEKGLSGRRIVASHNNVLLRFFKRFVVIDWGDRMRNAPTEDCAVVVQAELEHAKTALDTHTPTKAATDAEE